MSKPLLTVSSISKSFGGVAAINQVEFNVQRGEIHALIGPNGAGKSTLIALLCGEVKPDGGQVEFEGQDITGLASHKLAARGLARSFQITSVFPDMTVLDNITLAVQVNSGHSFRFWTPARTETKLVEHAITYMHETGLNSRADTLVKTLSHGERRQLELAMALALEPKLILLDEPLAGMSPEESKQVIALLRLLKGNKSILLVEHDMNAVFELADRITVLLYGQVLASGSPDQIRANQDVNRAYLGETN